MARVLTGPAVVLVVVALCSCQGPTAPARQTRKVVLVTVMEHALSQSSEAEKSAVLATTDEESESFAAESRLGAKAVEDARVELHALVDADGRQGERSSLEAFDVAWRQVQAIDARLLPLAVANTNLKAARIASGDGATTVNQLVDALTSVQAVTSGPAVLRELAGASVAALRIQSLLAPHIASAHDEEMTALEAQMRTHAATVEAALAHARERAAEPGRARVADAWEAWARYQHLTAEVVRLSRLNTNVVSFDLSVHEKRAASNVAHERLRAVRAAVEDLPRPTR